MSFTKILISFALISILLFLMFYPISEIENRTRKCESERREMLKLGAKMYRAQILITADSCVNINLLDSMFIDELKEIDDSLSKEMEIELKEL